MTFWEEDEADMKMSRASSSSTADREKEKEKVQRRLEMTDSLITDWPGDKRLKPDTFHKLPSCGYPVRQLDTGKGSAFSKARWRILLSKGSEAVRHQVIQQSSTFTSNIYKLAG